MKKFYLDNGYNDDFLLFGIVAQEKPHRLAWLINKQLLYHFTRKEDIIFYNPDQTEIYFSRFDYSDEINRLDYFLINNKDEGQSLIPELKRVDYLLMIKGALEYFKKRNFTTAMKTLESIQLITEIRHKSLKSKHNLIIPEL